MAKQRGIVRRAVYARSSRKVIMAVLVACLLEGRSTEGVQKTAQRRVVSGRVSGPPPQQRGQRKSPCR